MATQIRPVVINTFGHPFTTNEKYQEGIKATKDLCKLINGHLEGKDFLVGKTLTAADIIIFGIFYFPFQLYLDAGFRKAMPRVSAWFEKISKLP